MSRQLQVASKLGMRAVIRFLWAKRCNCTEIYRQLPEVYGENTIHVKLSRSGATCLRTDVQIDIDDAEREGRPSIATKSEIAARVNESILANRRAAVDEIANKLDISHGSMHKISVKHLEFS
ncbi:hypothetical protein AVEN_231629-1 [Araneus ventricosus]|uniref:Mos1 transposase HTH domain-containing protein n=1 Tax=Araneus ventricosus TaxID=182803 RepID=A0A4Y2QSV8_ARAVE|nr:hypothetical protein AVEN_231629-1 [Araneus ventricosus]